MYSNELLTKFIIYSNKLLTSFIMFSNKLLTILWTYIQINYELVFYYAFI